MTMTMNITNPITAGVVLVAIGYGIVLVASVISLTPKNKKTK